MKPTNNLINPPSFALIYINILPNELMVLFADLHQHFIQLINGTFLFLVGGGGFTRSFILVIDGW